MVLVTGATGLVGSHLLLHLLQNDGENVRALYRKEAQIETVKALFESRGLLDLFDAIEWTLGDILDVPSLEIAFQEVSHVYHCAGLISFDPSDEVALRKTNIEGTANIVNFCIDRQVKKLCHVSSIAALGDLESNETVVSETTQWNPERLHSDYAISKYGAEMEVWRGHQEGLQVVIVNPGVILGAGSWVQGSGLLFNRVWNGLSFYTKGITGYVAVEDVVRIMSTLMQSEVEGERYVVLSENLSYETIIAKIAQRMGVKSPSKLATSWMLQWAWRIDWVLSWFGKKRFLTHQGAESLQNRDLISNEKSKMDLPFEYESIDSCLDRVVPVFLKNYKI